jgi:hypothetical protein
MKKHGIMLYDCLIKTKHFVEMLNLKMECDICSVPAGKRIKLKIVYTKLDLGITIINFWYSRNPRLTAALA